MNDGFCDICCKFDGHENLKTLFGIFFCTDCRALWTSKKRGELIEEFRKIIGVKEPTNGG